MARTKKTIGETLRDDIAGRLARVLSVRNEEAERIDTKKTLETDRQAELNMKRQAQRASVEKASVSLGKEGRSKVYKKASENSPNTPAPKKKGDEA